LTGITRSLLLYHGIPFRGARLDRFYSQFVGRGLLAFDIGAHAGNRTRSWRRLGARVVAVEPQLDFVRLLAWLFRNDEQVTVLPLALGAGEGMGRLLVSERTPTVTTLSADWAAAVGDAESFRGVAWNSGPEVEMTTLDALIARFGAPRFVKVDVEGMEAEVLRGLSTPVPTLSFEYLPAARDRAFACLDRLAELGDYRYNWSVGESHRFAAPGWLEPAAMRERLARMRGDAGSGDVYARLALGV
jgi:FkbM family methyltransferase